MENSFVQNSTEDKLEKNDINDKERNMFSP